MFNCNCNSNIINSRTNSPEKSSNELTFKYLNQSKIFNIII